jgi:hypothetical protein
MHSRNTGARLSLPVKQGVFSGIIFLTLAVCTTPTWMEATEPAEPAIIISNTDDVVLNFAAQDLRRYLKRITSGPIEIGTLRAKHHIYVGALPPNASIPDKEQLQKDVEKLREDGFVIRSIGSDVVILGKGRRGNLYGCYAFLELQGVRWFFPGAQFEIVPQHALDWKTRLNVSESPAFPKRILFYWPNNYSSVVDWIDFSAKVRLNRMAFHYTWPARDWYPLLQSRLLPELRKRDMEIEVAGHFLSTFLPRTLLTEHPNWFRMNEQGKRVNDYNLNPFSHQALDYLASGAIPYLLKMPEASLFHLWADDIEGGGWSSEPGKEGYTPSDQALLVSNYLVKKLRGKLPSAQLAYLAYHDTVYPPRLVKPEPGLVYFYAPRERCYAHALNDLKCDLNRKYAAALENGLPTFGSARAEVFEYYVDEILYENMPNPPLAEVLTADLQYYHKLGIPAVGALMTNTSNFITPMVNLFLYPQAAWNPARDLNQSLKEYATLYFDDPKLTLYFQELSLGMREVLDVSHYEHPGTSWDSIRPDRESDEALDHHVRSLHDALAGPLARATSLLDQGARRAKNRIQHGRLEGEQIAMNFTLRQAKLYYHLLKGEQRYRAWKNRHDQTAGLDVLTELALARHASQMQMKFIATSGMKANPLIPSPRELEERVAELDKAITRDPASVMGANMAGFRIDQLDEQLMDGVTGYILSGPSGSRAVVWTDVAAQRAALRERATTLVWSDELGQPIAPEAVDLYASPVLVDAKGLSADKLFDALLEGQSLP